MRVLVLNGPNLNRLGTREPDVYGHDTLADIAAFCVDAGDALEIEADVRQTNSESELIGWLHEAAEQHVPVVLNPAAFTHYSYGVRDACAMLTAPLVEVHLSNPHAREEFRHRSVISAVATGVIAGFGKQGYALALEAIASATRPD